MALLLGCIGWCATALAASDIRVPCPDTLANSESTLPAVLEEDATAPQLQRLEATTIVTLPPISTDADDAESLPAKADETGEDNGLRNNEIPDLATRLPGVSASDALRLRRNMLRTDI